MKPILLGLALGLLAGCASTPLSTTPMIPSPTASSAFSSVSITDLSARTDASAIMPDLGVTIRSFGIDAYIDGKHEVGYVNAAPLCKVDSKATNCVLETTRPLHISRGVVGLFTGRDAGGSLCADGPIKPGTYQAYQEIVVAYRWTGNC